MVLVFSGYKHVESTTVVKTSSESYVDDTPATLSFTLAKPKIALILYNPSNKNDTNPYGLRYGISVDGSLVAAQYNSSYGSPRTTGALVFWIGQLSAGTHTIKGQFAACRSAYGDVHITNRTLTVILFDGNINDFAYIRAIGHVEVWSTSFKDDPDCVINLNLPYAQKALILYAASNDYDTVEDIEGKGVAVQVDGEDSVEQCDGPPLSGEVNHAFVAIQRTLDAGSHTIKGRFRAISGSAGVDERLIGVLLFDQTLPTDSVEDDVTKVTVKTGESYDDDTPAAVTRSTSQIYYLLAFYCNSKPYPNGNTYNGVKTALNVDGVDYYLSNRALYGAYSNYTVGLGAYLFLPVQPGDHTIKGRLAQVTADPIGATVTERTLECLWFSYKKGTVQPLPPPIKKLGEPVVKLDRYSGSDTTYQTLVSWVVASGKKGSLKEISMLSDNFDKTYFRLRIGGETKFEDKQIQSPLTLSFPDNELDEGTEVLLECKSTDGSVITVDGTIIGKEY